MLLLLLLVVVAAHSTGCCDQAHVGLVLDLPTKQHSNNAGSQPTCGGEVRGKINAQMCDTQTHAYTHAHVRGARAHTHVIEIIANFFFIYRHCAGLRSI